MVTKAEAKKMVAKLRKNIDPKFSKEITAVADYLDEIVESAADLGRQGGTARARKLSKGRRVEIARAAAKARWSKE